jgi:transcriptional regulator with GAF, ATPase, and Fis domain
MATSQMKNSRPRFGRPSARSWPSTQPSTQGRTLKEVEREHILTTLRDTHGVIGGSKGAAARLGVKRTTLLYKMEKLGLSRQPS